MAVNEVGKVTPDRPTWITRRKLRGETPDSIDPNCYNSNHFGKKTDQKRGYSKNAVYDP